MTGSDVNLPALTDGASAPFARLKLRDITVVTPPRPTGLVTRGRWTIGLAPRYGYESADGLR